MAEMAVTAGITPHRNKVAATPSPTTFGELIVTCDNMWRKVPMPQTTS